MKKALMVIVALIILSVLTSCNLFIQKKTENTDTADVKTQEETLNTPVIYEFYADW